MSYSCQQISLQHSFDMRDADTSSSSTVLPIIFGTHFINQKHGNILMSMTENDLCFKVTQIHISNDLSTEALGLYITNLASLGRGNEKLFKWFWSIDQDGSQGHIMLKPL